LKTTAGGIPDLARRVTVTESDTMPPRSCQGFSKALDEKVEIKEGYLAIGP